MEAMNKPMANVHGAALAILLRPPMMASWFALIKVSPSHARPRMPMIAVMPDWQVLHVGTSATGALVTVRIIAATASMTIAIAMGMPTTTGSAVLPGTVRNVGNSPANTTSATPPKKMKALALAPGLSDG